MSSLREQLNGILSRLAKGGCDVEELTCSEPASIEQVEKVEAELGFALPAAFRQILLDVSAEVDFSWSSADDAEFPEPFEASFSGQLQWNVSDILHYDLQRNEWIQSCFPNADDPYDAVWHRKLAFCAIPNGDMLAIDLAPERHGRIVYLSHDDGEGHNYTLARDFADLLRRWVPLGCPGAEDWQWLPFTRDAESGIDPDGENGRKWRDLLGLE